LISRYSLQTLSFFAAGVILLLGSSSQKPDHPTLAVNVEEFGAIADGRTDNARAINKAIASLHQGQTLFFPCTGGTYYKVYSPIKFGSMQYESIQGSGPGCYLLYSGRSSEPYAFSFAGAEIVDVRNMDFYSNFGVAPQTVLMLGRSNANTQSGQFKFIADRVEGFATQAIVYSIASEEDSWIDPTIIVNGGGARYGFYTSCSDDLRVDNLPTASNLSLWMQNFHLYDFSPSIDPAHALIYDVGKDSGAGNHTYRDGYLGSANGTAFAFASAGQNTIAYMGLTIDSNRFENGYQMFTFTGGGSFGDISLTNNKSSGVRRYMIDLPTTCYDCTFQGNNILAGDSAVSSFGTLSNSYVSESYPFTIARVVNSYVFNRTAGAPQIGSTGRQPVCSASTEGTLWYEKGTADRDGSFQICQLQSHKYIWMRH
jgi:hypothetical protein